MGTVSAPALLGGLVDLDVLDDQVAGVETLGVGVGLGVLEEREEVLRGLHGPPGTVDTELLACRKYPELAKDAHKASIMHNIPLSTRETERGDSPKRVYPTTRRSPSRKKAKIG